LRGLSRPGFDAQGSQADAVKALVVWEAPQPLSVVRVYYQSNSQHLTLAHARQTFPLYLPLLPRGTPGEFDEWCDQSGLREGLGAALRLIMQNNRQGLEFGF
jgi:hypothetical protein